MLTQVNNQNWRVTPKRRISSQHSRHSSFFLLRKKKCTFHTFSQAIDITIKCVIFVNEFFFAVSFDQTVQIDYNLDVASRE